MANAGQHTIKYKKEGDYGHLVPRISPVEYHSGTKIKKGTCLRCTYGEKGPHSLECSYEKMRLQLLIGSDY